MLKYYVFLLLWTGFCKAGMAQEINAAVQIDRSQVNNASFNNLDHFADKLQTYLNDYSWTNDRFRSYERINVAFQVTLLSTGHNHTYHANIVIRSLRPISNTNRKTTVILFHDKNWTFHYTPNSELIHHPFQFNDITTLLDYYAYIILGYSYDSFSPLGGTPYFTKAQHFVSRAQATGLPGWSRAGNKHRNRAQLASALLSSRSHPLRKASYIYYKKGLDLFVRKPAKARQDILHALRLVQKARRQTTNALLFDIFFNTKTDKLVAIFEDASADIQRQAYQLLSHIDPPHLPVYDELQ